MKNIVITAASIVVLAMPFSLGAQTLSGRVVDAETGAPVPAGFVRLIDTSGARVAETLTNQAGLYRVSASAAGRYVVRIERLGYRTFESEPIVLDSSMVRDFRLPSTAIELQAITAKSTSRCVKREAMTPETTLLWDEVRKAIALASWTSQNAAVHFDLVGRTSTIGMGGRVLHRNEPERVSGTKHSSPFAALARDSLLTKGFIQKADSGHFKYFAPDAELIMSDDFQATHCFRATIDRKRPGLVGLGFEPTGAIKPYDVRGTMWIDRKSGLLTRLEFTYDKLPVAVPAGSANGDVDFARMDNGMWIVSGWSLRVPIVMKAMTPAGTRDMFSSVSEKSQHVVRATVDGKLVYMGAEVD